MSTDFGRKDMLANLKDFNSSWLYSVCLPSGDSDRAENRHVSGSGTRIAHEDRRLPFVDNSDIDTRACESIGAHDPCGASPQDEDVDVRFTRGYHGVRKQR